MKKILIADCLFVEAHRQMNIDLINAVSQCAETSIISLNGYYKDETQFKKKVSVIPINLNLRNGSIGTRLSRIALNNRIKTILKKDNYDAIIYLGFDTIAFSVSSGKNNKTPVFLFHHNNIDELTSKIKRVIFGRYKNQTYHIVFEEFFRDRLINDIHVLPDRVFVVPHPAQSIANMQTDKSYDCIGLCNSNDENLIQEAVMRDNEFEQRGLHILLRSKIREKKAGAVEVIKGFMDKDVYDELMAAGKTVFVPLPETYIYRLSGSIYDALSRRKLVYTTSKYYAQEYERRYPGICKYVGSVNQLIERLQEKNDIEVSGASFNKFIEGHSVEMVSDCIDRMIGTVLERT